MVQAPISGRFRHCLASARVTGFDPIRPLGNDRFPGAHRLGQRRESPIQNGISLAQPEPPNSTRTLTPIPTIPQACEFWENGNFEGGSTQSGASVESGG